VTSNSARAAVLTRALFASIHQDRGAAGDVYTDDVRAWTPAISTSSLAELMAEFDRRDDAFSDIELDVAPLEVGGDYACAEWSVTMTHTGQLAVDRGRMVKPTGARVTLHGITVAEFRGDRICSLRQYWDELNVFDQLGLLHDDGELDEL
jgi:ketosteroid isomerase-like protein